jgi:drug/metabolite transporter (DMT)-like permease
MKYDTKTIFWIFVAAFALAVPVPLIKRYTQTKDMGPLCLAIGSYYVLVYAYMELFAKNDFIVISPVVKVLSLVMVVASAILFFGSRLTPRIVAGLVAAIVSIILLGYK